MVQRIALYVSVCFFAGAGVLLLWCVVPSWSQTPTPEPIPACEIKTDELYKGLAADRLLYDSSVTAWMPQLSTITTQLRMALTQYRMQQQQTELAQRDAAAQAEVVRQLQQALTKAQGRVQELEARDGAAPPAR